MGLFQRQQLLHELVVLRIGDARRIFNVVIAVMSIDFSAQSLEPLPITLMRTDRMLISESRVAGSRVAGSRVAGSWIARTRVTRVRLALRSRALWRRAHENTRAARSVPARKPAWSSWSYRALICLSMAAAELS